MHGVAKTQMDAKTKEALDAKRRKKIDAYICAKNSIVEKMENDVFDLDGLQMTRKVLEQNPDVYTFWNYRKKCLSKMNENIKDICLGELDLTENCLHKNPKSYGAWHHRYWVVDFMQNEQKIEVDFKAELKRCGEMLRLDERNFHCWDYWRSICKLARIDLNEQLNYCDAKIKANFSNYSAWHCRSTLLTKIHQSPLSNSLDTSVLKSELDLVRNAIFTDPEDQSAFLYRDWLIRKLIDQRAFIKCDKSIKSIGNQQINHQFEINRADIDQCLQNDLNQLRQLVEMEPKEKWPLLSLVLSLKYLDDEKNDGEILNGIEKLKAIDPLRKNYYQHLATSCRMISS